jgi:ubiquinone biosynthesis monooxygenase Coq7
MITQRNYSHLDHAIMGISRMLETLGAAPHAARAFPADSEDNESLSEHNRRQSGRYMRVNHVGEICAQALYHSQALTARDNRTHDQMQQAAAEENDHLAWCEQRIDELGGRKSLLNPLWYTGAFTIGALAGIAGDKWSLGFVAETERQVVDHLDRHLGKLPENDGRSREVVAQMKLDENNHAEAAVAAGAAELPRPVRRLMQLASKVMTSTAHWI